MSFMTGQHSCVKAVTAVTCKHMTGKTDLPAAEPLVLALAAVQVQSACLPSASSPVQHDRHCCNVHMSRVQSTRLVVSACMQHVLHATWNAKP